MKKFFMLVMIMTVIFNNVVFANGCLHKVDIVSTYDNMVEIEYNNNIYVIEVDSDIQYRNRTSVLIYMDDENRILWIE